MPKCCMSALHATVPSTKCGACLQASKKTRADDEVRLNRARFALRTIDPGLGKVTDSTTYIVKWGQVITSENNPALYDPRRRPWYLDAWKQTGLVDFDVYIFFTTGEPGLTLSRRIATRDDTPVGTVGIDIPAGRIVTVHGASADRATPALLSSSTITGT